MDIHLAALRENLQDVESLALHATRSASSEVNAARREAGAELQRRAAVERDALPEVSGGCDEVLVHHFGAHAINQDIERCLRLLETRILAEGQRERDVPLLFCYRSDEQPRVAAVRVPLDHVTAPFQSIASQKSMPMHAFTNQSEIVETLTLTIRGTCVSCVGDLHRSSLQLGTVSDSFEIHQTSIAANGRGKGHGTYCFCDQESDDVFRFSKLHEQSVERVHLVGFNEIAEYLERGNAGSAPYRTAARLLAAVGFEAFTMDARRHFLNAARRHGD